MTGFTKCLLPPSTSLELEVEGSNLPLRKYLLFSLTDSGDNVAQLVDDSVYMHTVRMAKVPQRLDIWRIEKAKKDDNS